MFKDTNLNTNLKLTDIQEKILNYLASHPQATQTELLNAIKNVTLNGIKYNTTRLQDLGLLKRIGSKRSG